MKRVKTFLLLFSLVFAVSLVLTACGGTKLPKKDYEKVKFAFDGVEKSFKNPKKSSASSEDLIKYLSFNPTTTDLDIIKNSYTAGDNQGDVIDEIEYNEPPMIQFQCLKKVLEKIGSNYSFGTKYYDTMTGTIYADMETGKDMSSESNKNNYVAAYTITMSIDISIDSNDLINADVCFDISVTQNNKEYNTFWYVALILDYDMENKTPNYTLTMLTNNEEDDLEYRLGFTYEYDYVEVKDSAIKEWRKFCFESDQKMVKDSTHSSFDDFSDVEYDVGTVKWYYNNNLYKFTKKDPERANTIANVFYRMGLTSTDIDGQSFINKQGTKNSTIKTIYDDFSKAFKKDVMYSFVTGEEHSDHGDDNEITGIRIMMDENTGLENITVEDQMIGNLVSGFIDAYGEKFGPIVYYTNKDGGNVSRANIGQLSYYISIYDDTQQLCEPVLITSGDLISQAYVKAMQERNISFYDPSFKLILKDEEMGVTGGTFYSYQGDAPDTGNKEFPEAALSYGVPEFEGANAKFEFENQSGGAILVKIWDATIDEGLNYFTTITKAGFELKTEYNEKNKEYVKTKSETQVLHIKFDITNQNQFNINAWVETVDPGGDEHGGDEPEPIIIMNVGLMGNFNNWDPKSNLRPFDPDGGNRFQLFGCTLDAGDSFKIVCNFGELQYGYTDIIGIDQPKYFSALSEGNKVGVLESCRFDIMFNMDDDNVPYIQIRIVESFS